jgi:hypothetical protein
VGDFDLFVSLTCWLSFRIDCDDQELLVFCQMVTITARLHTELSFAAACCNSVLTNCLIDGYLVHNQIGNTTAGSG